MHCAPRLLELLRVHTTERTRIEWRLLENPKWSGVREGRGGRGPVVQSPFKPSQTFFVFVCNPPSRLL